MSRATAIATLLAILLAEPTLARPRAADADPGTYRPHHRHSYHYRHYSRHHPVRIHSDPPGVKWTELPPAPEPEAKAEPQTKPQAIQGSFVLVRTISIPASPPIFEPRRLIPPSSTPMGTEQARAYCITHKLNCAP